VLLHGFPQSTACWIRVAETLAAARYRMLAPDQRGYPAGARPAAVRAYRMPELVADVLALAEAARFHLVGHDWGGAVAWALAGRHVALSRRTDRAPGCADRRRPGLPGQVPGRRPEGARRVP
jgi:alpha-beta hydrolase superfamily lysophospholipase